MKFDKHVLDFDPGEESQRIVSAMEHNVHKVMRRLGAVVGVSGGVDSAVVLGLCVRAFGPEKVIALNLPERESDPNSKNLARSVANRFGVRPQVEDITAALEGFGCYRRRDEAVRKLFPEYDPAAGYKIKLVLPENLLEEGTLNLFSLILVRPDGEQVSKPVPVRELLQTVASSNFKQRTRMAMLYYHADRKHYAVIGTGNKNEHDQGFFVKYGDGGVDINPIGHLYKTQVYRLADSLGVPDEIRFRPPTTDTYSAPCTQQEFFFRLPFETMDLLWYAMEHEVPVADVARVMELSEVQVRRAFDDFTRKRRTTDYLRLGPLNVPELSAA
jgi:NAD+ synthase